MVERTLISFPSQLQLIDRLQHLLYLSSSMVFISGEKGSGKSTLIEQLSNQLPDATQQAFIRLAEPTSVAQIRQQIISQLFEQPLFDADDTLCNVIKLLKNKGNSGISRVVVIDNAQLLPELLLHELAEVIKQKSLLSDNEINFIFISDQLKNQEMVNNYKKSLNNQGVTALVFKLPPLDITEAKKLLTHSFLQLGYSPKIQHQDAVAKQLLNCQGIPEKILQLATEVSSGHLDDELPSWLKIRFPAILLMLALLVVVGGLAWYLYPKFIKQPLEVDTIVESEAILLDEIQSTDLIIDQNIKADTAEPLAGQWSNNKKVITDNTLSVGEADNKKRAVILDPQLLDIEKSTIASSFESEKNIPNVANEVKQESSRPVALIIDNSDSALDEQVTEPNLSESASEQQLGVKVTTLVTELSITSLKHKPFTPSEQLLAINPNFYTLQLAAMHSEKSLQAFIIEHQLAEKHISLYQTIRNGKKWYVVIYGQFKSRQAALNEVKKLSNSPMKLDSWAKKYASIHQDLQLNE